MQPKKKPFRGFGVPILEIIIGAAQIAAQGSATAVQQDKVRREQRKRSQLLDLLHQQRLKEIEAEGVARDEALRLQSEAELYEEKATRATLYGGVVIAILGAMLLTFFLIKGAPNE